VDYQGLSGSVTIPAGSSAANIPVIPIDDTIVESSETVTLNLSTSPDYLVGSPGSATMTIADNDQPPAQGPRHGCATRPNASESGTAGVFTISRTGGTGSALTVQYTSRQWAKRRGLSNHSHLGNHPGRQRLGGCRDSSIDDSSPEIDEPVY